MDNYKTLTEDLSFTKLRILERGNGRMKLTFNLNTDEATAFKNFFNAINVNNNSEGEFIKAAFILGLRSMEQSIMEKMKAEVEKAQEGKADDASVEFVEEKTETENSDESTDSKD